MSLFQIKIREQHAPFSHLPGSCCLIPHTTWELEAFPTRLCFRDRATSGSTTYEIALHIRGLIEDFTLKLDLEKGQVSVFGHAREGYFHLILAMIDQEILLRVDRAPSSGIRLADSKREAVLNTQDLWILPLQCLHISSKKEREKLSLGVHKKQDWASVLRRLDLREILPIWYSLSENTAHVQPRVRREGFLTLIEECRHYIKQREHGALVSQFEALVAGAFQGILSPRLNDERHLGLLPPNATPTEASPLPLLHEGAQLIRALFYQEHAEALALLPCLPKEFDCGRLIGLQTESGDRIDIEWSKKLLKKVIWHSGRSQKRRLHLRSALARFRLRSSGRDRGRRIGVEEEFELERDRRYYFDRFEK